MRSTIFLPVKFRKTEFQLNKEALEWNSATKKRKEVKRMDDKEKISNKKKPADITELYIQALRMESRAYIVLAISVVIFLVNAFLAIKKLTL